MSDQTVPGKLVTVVPERLPGWLRGFAERHGETSWTAPTPDTVEVRAADSATARCTVPFPPLDVAGDEPYGGLIRHAQRDRCVGVVLVRRGGYAAGVFNGRRLVASKVGSRHVQGRTAAGGQSQRRFARRREKQAREAFEATADVVARVVVPWENQLEAVVTGGDRSAVNQVLADRRLAGLEQLVVPSLLAVPDPKLTVLQGTADQFRAVSILVREPA